MSERFSVGPIQATQRMPKKAPRNLSLLLSGLPSATKLGQVESAINASITWPNEFAKYLLKERNEKYETFLFVAAVEKMGRSLNEKNRRKIANRFFPSGIR